MRASCFSTFRYDGSRNNWDINCWSCVAANSSLGTRVVAEREAKFSAGRRVAVQIDGGRVRLRENRKPRKKGKRKKGTRQKFETPWREPKALIIFEFNDQGKMVKKERQPLIDGTLLGPDHLAELVAFHLHRLGVAQAETVVFISDGARWIWDRLEWIEKRAGLDRAEERCTYWTFVTPPITSAWRCRTWATRRRCVASDSWNCGSCCTVAVLTRWCRN